MSALTATPLHQAAPNPGHLALKELQDLGKLRFLITQTTPLDSQADLRFFEPIGDVLPAAVLQVKGLMGRYE